MRKKIFLSVALLTALASADAQDWSLLGNVGTNANTNFIGTTDNRGFAIRTNNTERIRVLSNGLIGFGITLPDAAFHIKTTALRDGLKLQFDNTTRLFMGTGGGLSVGSGIAAPDSGLFVNGRTGMGTSFPLAKLHVNSGLTEAALRVQVNSSTKLIVNSNGGVSIGTAVGGPANGLYIAGNLGIGDNAPVNRLDVNGNAGITGNLTLSGTTPLLRVGTADGSKIQIGTVESFEDYGSNTFGSSSNIVPLTDNSRSLGSSIFRWASLWAADGTINTSDARQKKNIRDLNYGLAEIMKLRAVKFNWIKGNTTDDKLGVVAQEIQKVLPEVVRDYDYKVDEATGSVEKIPAASLGVMYADIIPVLIKGMQEQQVMIEAMKKEIAELKKTSAGSSAANGVTASAGLLEQNTPNPFSSVTTIRYQAPSNVSSVQIVVTNASGNAVKTFTGLIKGNGSVTISANELAAGTYYYSLIADGKKLDTKKMVLVK